MLKLLKRHKVKGPIPKNPASVVTFDPFHHFNLFTSPFTMSLPAAFSLQPSAISQ
jgi:hypothetical protein